jgi:hypothetical protein
MHSGDDINAPNKSLVEIANQLSALSHQVSKLNEDLTSTKEEISKTKKALSKIPTNDGDSSSTVIIATIFLSLIIALTSNPSKSDHVTHLLTRMPGSSNEMKAAKKLVGDYALPYLAPNLLSYESHYFFSVSKLGEFPLSLGIFGNVFDYKTPDEIKEKFNKLTD